MKKKTSDKPEIHLIYEENLLTIYPTVPQLEDKVLTYTEKSMERQPFPPFKMVSRKKRTPIFNRYEKDGTPYIITWQGIWKRVCDWLQAHGYVVRFHDERSAFPKPNLQLMGGFRYSQEALLIEGLRKDASGLIGAPTRYGKSTLIKNTLKAYPDLNRVVVVPGKDLVRQMHADIVETFSFRTKSGKMQPMFKIPIIGAGSTARYMGDEITVCSMDSMHKLDPGKVDMLLVDEPHMLVTDSRLEAFGQFHKARKLGFGATLNGRFDGRDVLIEAMLGPVLCNRTYRDAVIEGAVCQITAFIIEVPFVPPSKNLERDVIYRHLLFESERLGGFMSWLCKYLLPDAWQTLIFIDNEPSAEHYTKYVGAEGTIAMAKRMTDSERKVLTERMKDDDIKRCLATVIYSTGVTFNHVRTVVNLEGGGPYSGNIQKPGRVAEVRPGKTRGVVFDFKFVPVNFVDDGRPGAWRSLVREGEQRQEMYEEIGYEVLCFDIDQKTAIETAFQAICLSENERRAIPQCS